MLNEILLDDYAKKYKIDKFTILREYLQIVFLNSLFQNAKNDSLVFKGGTSLRLIYGSPRFSEDLDFNTTVTKNKIVDLVNESVKMASKIIPDLYQKEVETIQGYSTKLYFRMKKLPMPLTVKLDFSFREKTISTMQRTIPTQLPIQSYSLIKVMTEEEILAEKLRTIFQRSKGRDIFDIWYLLNKTTPINNLYLKEKFKMIDLKFNLEKVIYQIKQFDDKKIKDDLNKFLPLDQRKLIPELKKLIIFFLSDNQLPKG